MDQAEIAYQDEERLVTTAITVSGLCDRLELFTGRMQSGT
jgi:hypothetical protein